MRMLCAFSFIFVILANGVWAQSDQRFMTIEGVGVVQAVPDMAVIQLGVTTQAPTAEAALAQASAKMQAAMDSLASLDVARVDMQTSDLSLSPIFDRQQTRENAPTIIGYQTGNRLSVTVRDLDNLGAILDAVARDGLNQFWGLQFSLAEPRAATDDARKLAVADARAKAELYAQAAGVTLGALTNLAEGGGQAAPMMVQMEAARSAVPVAEGQVSQTARVRLTYEIVD
ncbi:SIMPL domain-containing protein [Nereida sp. MMG025]|uniref:SIMPL domain-containing protein n=1 Tax=Nereida sp. MMG025 TaxID=2909981 RepID=UPI001F1E16E3|nr:SIMPL domain-containing protein [Nereida sp. MMG025]MCF6445175.1 SIMPL domain-containing protein [Nereida sp. MMG025]